MVCSAMLDSFFNSVRLYRVKSGALLAIFKEHHLLDVMILDGIFEVIGQFVDPMISWGSGFVDLEVGTEFSRSLVR